MREVRRSPADDGIRRDASSERPPLTVVETQLLLPGRARLAAPERSTVIVNPCSEAAPKANSRLVRVLFESCRHCR